MFKKKDNVNKKKNGSGKRGTDLFKYYHMFGVFHKTTVYVTYGLLLLNLFLFNLKF